MKIFTAEQIRAIDAATIKSEPVSSVDLMERAAGAMLRYVESHVPLTVKVTLFAGPGNNGGDALALARMMKGKGYNIKVLIVSEGSSFSGDFNINLKRLEATGAEIINADAGSLAETEISQVIIDGIFGSGLSRPVSGIAEKAIRKINSSGARVISVDIPSGLSCDGTVPADPDLVVKARETLTFQFPKLPFMTEEGCLFAGDWHILDIGLSAEAAEREQTPYLYVTREEILPLLKQRSRFDHKGVYGHALLVAGSYGKAGAAILSSGAALRTGAGLVTCHSPGECVAPIQCRVPEAMVSTDEGKTHITSLPDLSKYDAIGIGPGIGTDPDTRRVLAGLLASYRKPVVLDADALNILALEPDMLSLVPENSILTPHPGEFARLTGKKEGGFSRIETQMIFAKRYKCIVLLKGAFTSVAMPDGRVCFNSTGNPGMATAGSGDVLTGIITSLLAQGYGPEKAAITGAFLHGLAGDIALEKHSYQSLLAGDIVKNIGRAYRKMQPATL